MAVMKSFKKKAAITFDYDGVAFELPGKMPLAATLYILDMQANKGEDAVMTGEDVRQLYTAMLGEANATKLIDELGASDDDLNEIIEWYGSVITERNSKEVSTNPKAKRAVK